MSVRERILRASAAAAVLVVAAVSVGQSVPNVVYYQVTYEDGGVRDLSRVPQTDEGIRRVLRIARYEGSDRGYEVLSTDRPLTVVERGYTQRHELIWRDGAWVAPVDIERRRREALERTQSLPRTRPTDSAEAAWLEQQLHGLGERLDEVERLLPQTEDELIEARGTDSEQDARAAMRELIIEHDRLLRAIRFVEQRLAAERGELAEIPEPSGQLQPYRPDESDRPELGTVEPIEDSAIPPHRVHVWKLPEAEGRRSIRVAAGHPEAGAFGAMVYVAYADTDGDGTPDEFLARSPTAIADRPGRWTSWTFETDSPRVYVGCALGGEDNTAYFRPAAGRGDDWVGIDADVYVSDGIEFVPRWRSRRFLSNVRIHVIRETGGSD